MVLLVLGVMALLEPCARAQSTLFDNGPVSTGNMTVSGNPAPAGTTWSELQFDSGNVDESNVGIGYADSIETTGINPPTGGYRLADDFTIPAGSTWSITSVFIYGYVISAPLTPSPFDVVHLQIWNGRPGDPGAIVVFGNLTTNRLINSTDTAIYRIYNTFVPQPGIAPETSRRVWKNEVSTKSAVTSGTPLLLGPGTYWIEFQSSDTSHNTTHFAPSVTTPGARTQPGQNARQFRGPTPGHWVDLIDPGLPNSAPDVMQDVPFQIRGTMVASTPCTLALPPCRADIAPAGGNGQVDVDDLLAVINTWGQNTFPAGPRPQGDVAPPPNGDCKVNVDDILGVINSWGLCP